jgi:hypothetical protein
MGVVRGGVPIRVESCFGMMVDKGPLTHKVGVPARQEPRNYYSVLADVISQTETDPAFLRATVYELARFNLKREALFGYPPMSIPELARHMDELEKAIARVETTSGNSSYLPPPSAALPNNGEPANQPAKPLVIMPGELMPPIYESPIPAEPFAQPRERRGLRALLQLVGATTIGLSAFAIVVIAIAIMFGVTGQMRLGKPLASVQVSDKPPAALAAAPSPPPLPYPIPSAYGIYAISNDKLAELLALPLRVPDPRVPLSTEITKPSATTITDTKPTFILFRRDLVNNAPEKLSLRVVAKVVREMKFVQGKPVISPVEDSWRIRSNAYDLKVSPVPGHNEMVIVGGPDDFRLAPGRYALVLNNIGYDFTVAGARLSQAHCLERFETTSGDNYTECRAP